MMLVAGWLVGLLNTNGWWYDDVSACVFFYTEVYLMDIVFSLLGTCAIVMYVGFVVVMVKKNCAFLLFYINWNTAYTHTNTHTTLTFYYFVSVSVFQIIKTFES